jgi:hypothetical protein
MSQMFHLDVSKVDQVLYMLQWRRWLANSGLPQGFSSYLAWRASPTPLLFLLSPFLPFPPSHHDSLSSATRHDVGMARAEGKGVWLSAGATRMRMSQVMWALWALSFTWGHNGMWWCVWTGATFGHVLRLDVWALAAPMMQCKATFGTHLLCYESNFFALVSKCSSISKGKTILVKHLVECIVMNGWEKKIYIGLVEDCFFTFTRGALL